MYICLFIYLFISVMKGLRLDNDEKLRNSYKHIVFNYNLSAPSYNHDIKPTVSFNTVPLILGTSSYDSDFKGVNVGLVAMSSLGNDIQTLKKNFDDLTSLTFQSYNNIDKMFHLTADGKLVRKDYPSRPTIINDSMIINHYYLDWLQSWKSYRLEIENRLTSQKPSIFKYPDILIPSFNPKPIMMKDDYVPLTKSQRKKMSIINSKIPSVTSPRTIVCHLNGRKHTWVPLDWLLASGLRDLDHLVVLTNIPRMLHKIDPAVKKFDIDTTRNCNTSDTDKNRWGDSLIYQKSCILETCRNILTYIYFLLSNRKCTTRIKITVDVSIGKTKKILIDAINLYTPDIIIVPTLKWERNSKLIDIKSNCLKDTLCVHFPIPTIVVPVKRLFQFELNLQQRFNNASFQTDNNHDIIAGTTGVSLSPQSSSIITSDESLRSVDSFTADYCYSEMTTISNNLSSCSYKNNTNNDNKNKNSSSSRRNDYDDDDDVVVVDWETVNQEQFLLDIQGLPITAQLYLVAKRYRKNMHKEISQLETDKNKMTRPDYLIQKLDSVLNNSIGGSLMINNLKDYEVSDDVDLKGFARLKRVITGGEPVCCLSPRPMTDVLAYKSNGSSNRKEVSNKNGTSVNKRGSSQIIFASDVKIQDGKKALGNLKTGRSSSNSGNPIISTTLPRKPSVNQNNNILRKVCSNDSSKSALSTKSDNSLYPKKISIFNSKKKSISTPSSRRNSNSSGKSQITLASLSSSSSSPASSGRKRNLISKIFGLK